MSSFDSTASLSTVRLPGPQELRKKAHARLAERIDPIRTKHKPLSILRQEAKRLLDQLFDQEAGHFTRPDRDRLLEDILAEAPTVGVLEDLYRDEAAKEILILAHNQIIAKKNDVWLPTSARFRDVAQFRSVLGYYFSTGEPLVPAGPTTSGFDLRLFNGFRLMAILPPQVMDIPPQVLLIRAGAPSPAMNSPAPVGYGSSANIHITPAPRGAAPNGTSGSGGSGAVNVSLNARGSGPLAPPTSGSGVVTLSTLGRPAEGASGRLGPMLNTPAPLDPYSRFREKVAERIVIKFASAGVYDLNIVPLPDLRRIILAHVMEYCEQDKMGYDEATQERLALEILANMNR